MARDLNKVLLIGNLEQDPELRHTNNGTPVCTMRLTTTERFRNSSDEWVQRTERHSIVAWNRLAEICDQYLRKGSGVYFEGQLQTRSWKDRDGSTRYTTEVRVREMCMLRGWNQTGHNASPPKPPEERTQKSFSNADAGSNAPSSASTYGATSKTGSSHVNAGNDTAFNPTADNTALDPDDDLPF